MTIHATLLNQLEAFEERFGVKVVPSLETNHGPSVLEYYDDLNEYRWWCEAADDIEECANFHAHTHIREGARKAVEWWCRSKRDNRSDSGCFTEDYGDEVIVSWVRIDSESHAHERTLGYGPTTEDALSGALSHILKEKAE